MVSLGFLVFLSAVLIHLCISSNAQPTYRYHICSTAGNYTTGSQYRANFNSLFSSLSSNATLHNVFYNATAGQNSDQVYAIYLCRGDASPDVCRDCVSASSQEILLRCPNQKEAIIWFDECMFRYSNRSIFATMEDTPFGFLKNPNNYSDPVQFKQIREDLLERLVTKAISDSSTGMFATRETNFSGNLKIYGMVQCTPDISLSDCNICLRGSVAEIPNCCEGKKGARVLKPSCNIRYESFPFIEQKATAPASPTISDREDMTSLDASIQRRCFSWKVALTMMTRREMGYDRHSGDGKGNDVPYHPI
ncbi:hypothetical protein HHK36_005561 [Tetracentron sinense]|uniref:Gnk2-homologous domain-containing protein n=1 Tax=Tetracentron sinense TaxID=13715 RepID=A0A834ZPM1_TETSI|nr:hypothetical protein HHK36_005561 [Tetracentron sinense]